MEEFCLGVGVLGATEQPLPHPGLPSAPVSPVSDHSPTTASLVQVRGLPDDVEGDPGHADHQADGVDRGDVGALDDDGEAKAEDLLEDAGHAEGEAAGVGDQEVLGHLHAEGDDPSDTDPSHRGEEQQAVVEPEEGGGRRYLDSLEGDGEGEEDDDHDWLDVVDHVDGVGQPQLGLLHDQLGHGPPDPAQEGGAEDHHEAGQDELGALVGEHGQTRADHHHDQDQTPVLLLQSEEDGEHEDEDDAGGLGDGVQGHVYELEAPLRQGDVKGGHHCYHSYPAQHITPA